MLKRLSIKNVALIERLDMDFDNGLNVLTGAHSVLCRYSNR